ncbi:MAG: S8 family serine peptidase [Candidatus Thorarchaeota archaeon]|nr:S8 family serine peptidase [Candidatus Thorarchaeota archaeon]
MTRHRIATQRIYLLLVVSLLVLPICVPPVSLLHSTGTTAESVISSELAALIADSSERIPVILQFAPGTDQDTMRHAVERSGVDDIEIRHVFQIIPVVSLYADAQSVRALTTINGVVRVDRDVKRSVAPVIGSPDELLINGHPGYVHPDAILGVEAMWAQGYNGSGVTVAVVDSGAYGDHPDLSGRLVGFKDFVRKNRDDMDPSDGVNAYDDNGHGTACTWLVVGSGSGLGGVYTGMAPGAKVLVIKVLDSSGSADDSVVAQGIEFAVSQGVDVISLSLGGDWVDSSYTDPSIQTAKAAVDAGVSVVVAAGNSGPAAETINAPGILEEAITAGASEGSTGVASFSSRGPVTRTQTAPLGIYAKPDLLAPGYQVVSGRWDMANTYEFPTYNESQYGSLYTRWSGTSAATPLVAGLIALLLDKNSTLSPLDLKASLMAGATPLDSDYMAQGFGIANVSRTDEALMSTHGRITIAAPTVYPTLPWGQSVFIVGDSRPEQKVTIISTVHRGTATINMTGNASAYVTSSVSQLTVQKGYSHFDINLSIPEELPLTAVGRYLGQLRVVAGNDTLCSINLRFVITTFGGRLLVDMTHHSYDDVDEASYYKYFDDSLREHGIVMSDFGYPSSSKLISTETLAMADVFMVMDTETEYYQSEIDALHQFVDDGGTLLIFSEFYDNIAQQASFGIEYYNRILAPYGIQCQEYGIGGTVGDEFGVTYGTDYGGSVVAHPLTQGVNNLYVFAGSTLSVNESVPGTKGLFWIDSSAQRALVAVAQSGLGRVVVISDGSMVYDSTVFDSVLAGADNLMLLRNLAAYMKSDSPKIFNVSITRGGSGELARVTAYVFDNDLAQVEVSVRAPNGTVIKGTTTESLGYKFSGEYILPVSGFYEVTVTASDDAGHNRTYKKTVLVTAVPVDPELTAMVTLALLTVVAVGLGYVVLLKFGSRAKGSTRRRTPEAEWEVPVYDGTPPSIE